MDAAPRTTVGRASYQSVTWAVFFLDIDLDGHLDIFAANGGTDESQGMLDSRARLSQPPLLLRNRGDGRFDDVTRGAGEAFGRPAMGRGAAYADFDGDGDLDLVLTVLNGPARLLRNEGGNRNNWLRIRLAGAGSNRRGIGAVVRVTSASGAQWQAVRSGLELRLAERAAPDLRPRARCGGRVAGGDLAVRGDAALREYRRQPAGRRRGGIRSAAVSVRAVTRAAALPPPGA